jgi:hypothetical protein
MGIRKGIVSQRGEGMFSRCLVWTTGDLVSTPNWPMKHKSKNKFQEEGEVSLRNGQYEVALGHLGETWGGRRTYMSRAREMIWAVDKAWVSVSVKLPMSDWGHTGKLPYSWPMEVMGLDYRFPGLQWRLILSIPLASDLGEQAEHKWLMAYRARGFWSSVITKSNLSALLPIDQQK